MLTTTSVRPLPLHRPGVPYVHFPAYSRSQAVYIQCLSPPPLPETIARSLPTEEIAHIYKQFAVTVYDSLIAPTSTSLSSFRNVCQKLWPTFIWPAICGEAPPGGTKKWDFPRLLVRGRTLFHSDGESALLATIQPDSQVQTFDELLVQKTVPGRQADKQPTKSTTKSVPSRRSQLQPEALHPIVTQRTGKPLLTPLATLLLLCAHLSSHTPSKHDILLFSRLSTAASKHRKIRYIKRGNPGATPKKAMEDGRRKDKTKSLAPKSFGMERLLAIARAVHPEGVGNLGLREGRGKRRGREGEGWSDQVARAMGELERMRLVRREDDGQGEEGGGGKWKVNVGRDVVADMAGRQGLGVQEWELDL